MKKILQIIILLIVLVPVNSVSAYTYENFNLARDPGDIISYGIDDVSVTDDEIILEGWAYANGFHTIGGKTLKIDIIAIRNDDLELFASAPESVTNKVIGTLDGGYTGANSIYSSTCYTVGEKCKEVFYGYYANSYLSGTKRTGSYVLTGGSIGDGVSYATCTSDVSTSCIHYDPFFKIKFSIDDIYNLSGGSSQEIIFVLKMRFNNIETIYLESEGRSECSWSDTRGYINCDDTDDTYDVRRYRVLSFSESVMNYDSGKEIEARLKISPSNVFINSTNAGRLLTYDSFNKKMDPPGRPLYFDFRDGHNHFDIVGRQKAKPSTKGTGVTISGDGATYYKVKYNPSEFTILGESGSFVSPGSGGERYLTSFWGRVDGIVKIKPYEKINVPVEVCAGGSDWGCEESKYTSGDCVKKINKLYNSGDFLYNLNGGRCNNPSYSSYQPSISVSKFYKFNETVILNMRKDPSDINSPSIYETDRPWPGLPLLNKTKFVSTRTINWYPADTVSSLLSEYKRLYFYVIRYYDANPTGAVPDCKPDEGYVSVDYLLDKNISGVNSIINNASSDLDALVYDEILSDFNNDYTLDPDSGRYLNIDTLSISYPYSNDYYSGNKYNNDNVLNKIGSTTFGPIIKKETTDISGSNATMEFKTKTEFSIKDAYVKKNGDPFIVYSDSSPGAEYENIGSYYNIPYDVKSGDRLTFAISLRNPSVIETAEERIKSECFLYIEDGNRETMNYRVIDLNNPFPNYKPDLSLNKAVNWLSLWNDMSNDGFKDGSNISLLLQRVHNSNVENYNVDIYTKSDSLNKIRLHTAADNIYLNAYLKDDGTSKFINDNHGVNKIFYRSGNVSRTGIGEEAVSGR